MACGEPLITQQARKVYAMIHLHEPVEFWRATHVFGRVLLRHVQAGAATGSLDYAANDNTHFQRQGTGSVMVWVPSATIRSLRWCFWRGQGRRGGVQALDYYDQVLVPVVGPSFNSLLDYGGVQEGDYMWRIRHLFMERRE